MTQYLTRHTVADTNRFDEMRTALVDVYDARSFVARADHSRFFAKAGYVHIGSSSLSYCAYGSPVQIEFRDDNYFRFQFGISGAGQATAGRRLVEVRPDAIVSTPAKAILDFGHAFEQFALRVDRIALERDLLTLLGSRPVAPIEFDLSVNNATGQARRLRQIVFNDASSFDSADEDIPAPLLKEMDQTFRLAVLYGIPNSYSSRLALASKDSAPWQVKRIEEWIDAHWQESITIEKLVEISGASARSIFATFRNTRGYGPMAYVKKVRLNAARSILLQAAPGMSVTSAGLACNFFNLGKFARDYHARFGELPSETLRRAKVRAP